MNKCAQLVQAAYAQYAAFKSGAMWELPGDMVIVSTLSARPGGLFPHLEPFGFICRDEKSLYIVFRGTESTHDWLTNSDVDQVNHSYGKVHSGFEKLYNQMAGTIGSTVAKNTGFKIVVAGHSLGGSLATLAAFSLSAFNPTLYTFASPRVGDTDFAKNFNGAVPNANRIINTEDIVPTLPLPVCADTEYCHAGKPICFTFNSGTIVGNHSMDLYAKMAAA